MEEDPVFYIGQKAFIKKGNEVLILNDPKKGLDYPGGKIQEGETDLIASLKREVKEETGLEIKVGNAFTTWIREMPSYHAYAGKKVFLVGYQCEYVSGDVKLSDEHNNFSWVTKETYTALDKENPYYQALDTYFKI